MYPTKKYLALAITTTLFGSHAWPQDGQPLVLEEVTVTAQKTTELIQDVPITVSAVTGETFERNVAFDLQDLGKLVPGLSLESTGNNQNITLRGVGTKIQAAQSPRTNTYLDGSFINTQQLSFYSQFDIARFEVLKGPQGTLYGKASPTGSVVIHTRNPDLTGFEGFVQASAGEYDLFNTQFGISVPIIENELGVRIAGVYDENNSQDGEYSNIATDQLSRNKSARATLLWEPGAFFNARLSYTHVNLDGNTSSAFADAPGLGVSPFDRVELSDHERYTAARFDQTILEMNFDFDSYVLTSQSYFAQGTNNESKDTDRTSIDDANQDTQINFNHVFNQDLRFSSTGNETWDWITGLYYSHSMADTTVSNVADTDISSTFGFPPGTLVLPLETLVTLISSSEDFGWFTHNTFFISDDWTLTIGARWTREKRNNDNLADTYNLLNNTLLQGSTLSSDTKYIAWTGTIKLAYNLDVDKMLYLTLDRGGRGGGQTLDLADSTPDEIQEFDPESSNSLELGFKSDLMDGRMRLNAAAYYQIYNDFHYQALAAPLYDDADIGTANIVNTFDIIQNANEVVVSGAEVDVTYLFSHYFTGQLSISYNDAKFDDFDDAICTGGSEVIDSSEGFYSTCDFTGQRIGGDTGNWSSVAYGSFNLPLADTGLEWYFDLLYNFNSRRVSGITGKESGSFGTFDLFTGIRGADNGWDIKLWVKNAFDKEALVVEDLNESIVNGFINTGITPQERVVKPRQAGVTGVYRF